MRVMLAAVQCEKGDLAGNLAMHEQLLADAAAKGCEIVVFPEMSLTGSVDPRTHPGEAVAIDDDTVAALATVTRDHGVAALYGIAERTDDDRTFYIAQVYAHDGVVAGSYRKRMLGEGEEGFTAGGSSTVFHLGAVPFGVAVCADSGGDAPFADPAAQGASLVFFCAAPGLTGRRTDEAGWRDGFTWWEGAGLAEATRHARANRIWGALATQAGSTRDEDFPGLAALISREGEVVARLPDWHPGCLVVEIPVGGA